MNYKEDMERCKNYIEAHICQDITPRMVAEFLGYSFYHFCHVFRIYNNMPIGEYLRKQRLKKAIAALKTGERVTDIALSFGFDTPSGFSKAFRREFGMSAREYRKHAHKQILYESKGGMIMDVRVIKKDAFKSIGYSITPEDGHKVNMLESSAYWLGQDFSSVSNEDYSKLAKNSADQIGMWLHPDENGNLSYFLGPVVDSFDFIPESMIPIEIPSATYAVFTTEPTDLANDKEAFAIAIQKTWKYIFEEWFKESMYDFDQEKFAFEFYTDKNGGMDCNHAVADIYIPIKEKQ